MKTYALTKADGGVAIMQLLDERTTPQAQIARMHPTARADYTGDAVEINPASVPADRTFRNAWKPDLTVDMDKARALHLERIRAARNAKLATLDPLWQRAMGRGETAAAAAIEAQRETLRNLPQTVDLNAAATAEDLKAIWPAELNGR